MSLLFHRHLMEPRGRREGYLRARRRRRGRSLIHQQPLFNCSAGNGPHGYKGQWLKQSRSLEVLTIKILNGDGEFEDKKNIFERLKI